MTAAAVAALALAAAPVQVSVDVTPRAVPFGDAFTASATIVVETRAAEPEAVVVRVRPGPFAKLAEHREWTSAGSIAVLRVRARLACRGAGCLPGRNARRVRLPPLKVGEREVAWPEVQVLPRVPAAAVEADEPQWAVDDSLPPPSYRVAPDTAILGLLGLAAGLGAAGIALLALESSRALRRPRQPTPIERALARVRASLRGEAGERRRALGALSRALAPADRRLARSVSELAWAEPQPEPEAAEQLAARVEQEVAR